MKRANFAQIAALILLLMALPNDAQAQWSSGWFTYDGHQYRITNTMNWEDAQALAVSVSGNLVTINDAAENQWITQNLIPLAPEGYSPPNKALWIGLTQAPAAPEPSGGWGWVDGQTAAYLNWAPSEPNNQGGAFGNENRGSINELGGWNDFSSSISAGLGGVVEVVPEPGSAFILVAMGGIAMARRTRGLRYR